MARYPSDDSWFSRAFRPLNVLDDIDNKFSPTKINVWTSNCAGICAAAGTIFAWMGNHVAMLDHIGAVWSIVGPYIAGSHGLHQIDKRLNKEGK